MGVSRVDQGIGFADLPVYDGTPRLALGIDIGSKTVKIVVVDRGGQLRYASYDRHLSDVPRTLAYVLDRAAEVCPDEPMYVGVTGSAGMQLAEILSVPFIQEVVACRQALVQMLPKTDVAIEIGGEDSKIIYLTDGEELRMNSTCAGGTGGFIDTLAGMLDCNAEELNYYAHGCKSIHPIASRCAVFAQADVRPLLNEGVSREDIAGSVFDAVAIQCISGLACGRPIRGKVALLGGPMHFLSSLRARFQHHLDLADEDLLVPENGHLFVAVGAAFEAASRGSEVFTITRLRGLVSSMDWDADDSLLRLEPLFQSQEDIQTFRKRHASMKAKRMDISKYEGRAFLGMDSGSEAIKYVLIAEDGSILHSGYERSAGNLVEVARDLLIRLYKRIPRKHDGSSSITIAHATVTGYGEAFLKRALYFDSGEVETVSHVRAAQEIDPEVDFILDIGGQDIKCVWLQDGRVSDVILNEACSSGCGALVSGMAWSMNVHLDQFIESALEAQNPVDLGTRCTVFMTSRVRHAQKSGASVGDISAGLAYSVVRNAVHKVMRVDDASKLGEHIMVQGGTFANEAVLRAFEKVFDCEVIRPDIAPYMGAFGAALIARERGIAQEQSSLLDRARLESLTYMQKAVICKKCENSCHLMVTSFFDDGKKRIFTTGNRCARGESNASDEDYVERPNMFVLRERLLFNRPVLDEGVARRGSIGLIRALDMYELYPFWHAFFTKLGLSIVLSDGALEGRSLETIPSESLCLPAKQAHGQLMDLVNRNVPAIFAPYIDGISDARDACPVIADYPMVIQLALDTISPADTALVSPVIPVLFAEDGIADGVPEALQESLSRSWPDISLQEIREAIEAGVEALREYRTKLRNENLRVLEEARDQGSLVAIVAGRPYHGTSQIHHGIPELLTNCGYAVLTEDIVDNPEVSSLWRIPDRVVAAAEFAAVESDLDFVQLTSFGCGLDAAVSDKVRDVLACSGKMPTILKIDEMSDLASARIRIRSMLASRQGFKN